MQALVLGNSGTVAIPAVIKSTVNLQSLNVTPSTTAQTLTPTSPIDGYNVVNVAAVTSSIDANISANNIKSGVTILGTTGNLVGLNGTTTSITPTTSSQTVTPTSPNNGFTSVTVPAVTASIDANITAGNIKKDVQILGVTGTYEGSGGGGATSLGLDATQLIGKLDSNGKLRFPSTVYTPDFTGYTMPCKSYELAYQFYGTDCKCGGNLVFTDLTSVSGGSGGDYAGYGYFLYYSFYANNSVTSVSFPSLVTIEGYAYYSLSYAFTYCSYLTSISFPELTSINSGGCQSLFNYTWKDCNRLTSINFPKLTTIICNTSPFNYSFQNCTALTTVEFPKLETITLTSTSTYSYLFYYTFDGCRALTTARFPKLTSITTANNANYVFYYAFRGCTSLANVYFDSLTTWTGTTNPFNNMLNGCSNVTVHFKSSMRSAISALSSAIAGFGSSTTTILFDL